MSNNACTCTIVQLADNRPEHLAPEVWEQDPECIMHGGPFCEICGVPAWVVDEFDDQIGHEEQARPVHVVALDCGHQIVTETA